MPVSPTYPGVYVQEIPSGVRTIVGVSTSIGMFVGMAAKGPMFSAVRCSSYTDFVNTFSDNTIVGGLANYIRLFFLNGGTDCYVMRIAFNATSSSVTLQNEAGAPVLTLTAKDPGLAGEMIRANVTYGGPQPEVTFNMDLFRWQVDSNGRRTKTGIESWKNLSMDPNSPFFAPDFLTQNSKLVDAALAAPLPVSAGFSLSGRVVPGTFAAGIQPILSANNQFQISVGGSPFVDVSVAGVPAVQGTAATFIRAAIENRFLALALPPVTVAVAFPTSPVGRRLRIDSAGDVFVRPGAAPDLAAAMMMGTGQGGLEVGGLASSRPAANGITFNGMDPAALEVLAGTLQSALTGFQLDMQLPDGTFVAQNIPLNVVTTAAGNPIWMDNLPSSKNGNSDGVREKLAIIAQTINNFSAAPPGVSKWNAQVWGSRLAILPTDVDDNFISSVAIFQVTPIALTANFKLNVHYYTLGIGGTVGLQTPGTLGSDGSNPHPADYATAYLAIDKQVDLFNLMVLPPDATVPMSGIYPDASVFCQQRRAFLLMDPPPTWTDAQSGATGVAVLRTGLVKDYSALFFPRLIVDNNGKQVPLGPSGAAAGLFARIDGTRGVWKAPAGTEADLRGIVGLEQRFSDRENGWLNPRAVNTIRVFPNGIVLWGSRTMDGDDDFGSEYKYIPIRRLALYMEESLYRGLKWVVFEPNDEPLWSQIRLNVGAFMHQLFRQGAFQGGTPRDAYFVKCDGETTTPNDRNLGIVNIIVGFAPLKPAEFVILYLQQMAGQVQV